MVFDPGVRQACVDLTPTRKSDRRVKKRDLAIFRLQQYNRFLHVCLCPIATCLLLLLFYLFAEEYNQQSRTCSKFRTDPCDSPIAGSGPEKKVCALNTLVSRRQRRSNKCQKRSLCRMVTKCTMQILLLRAGDVESNPGPTRGVSKLKIKRQRGKSQGISLLCILYCGVYMYLKHDPVINSTGSGDSA